MKHHTLCIGLASMMLAASALAQTASPDNSRGAQEQQSQRKPCTSDSTNVNCKHQSSNDPSSASTTNHDADKSGGAQEQQSERRTCTGDHSNVNCKPKTTNGGDTGGTTP